MTSQTSLKELSKAISAFIVEPKVPLPDDLIETIAAYLRRHSKYDEAAADRLHEELLSIFEKHVRGNLVASSAWIGLLRRLLPMIQTNERVLFWIDALKGVLSTRPTHDKSIVEETVAALTDLVSLADEYQDVSESDNTLNPIMHQIFTIWMNRFYPGSVNGVTGMEHNERIFREALVQFGKRRPQQLFASLDSFFVQKDHRKAALRFLCDFIQNRPPHLHQILQGTMFKNLLTCLQQDTSTAVISSALTALIMLLPHMPSSLVPHLPVLFNIYARVLFWNPNKFEDAGSAGHDVEPLSGWDVYAYEADVEDASVTHLANYYTILYGLYPINFMDYIRKPQRYLRHANVVNADDIEIQPTEIRDQSEKFRRCHLLHPNFYSLTIESEKTDFGRFIKSEAAEVVAECMELYVDPESLNGAFFDTGLTVAAQSPPATDEAQKSTLDSALLRKSSSHDINVFLSNQSGRTNSTSTIVRRNSQSSGASNRDLSQVRGADSVPDVPRLIQSASHTHLQDIIHANKSIKSGMHGGDVDVTQPRANSVADPTAITRIPTPSPEATLSVQLAHLQRQNLLLQNDLSFERYQKQQHIAHIGDLRRRQLAEAVTEAETQNLIIMNRNLKSRFEEAKKAEMQVRKESEQRRAIGKKWEADLATKMKNQRDQFQKCSVELQGVRRELEESEREREKLVKLVCEGEVRELNAQQNTQSIEMHGAEVDRLKEEVDRLKASERDYQAKEQEGMAALQSAAIAEAKLEEMSMKVSAQASELEQTRKLFQTQYAALQAELAGAQGRDKAQVAVEREEMMKALAASRAKQTDLQMQYNLLMRKYSALQSSLLDMDSETVPDQSNVPPQSQPAAGDEYIPGVGAATLRFKTRPRDASNPDTMEAVSTEPNSAPTAAVPGHAVAQRPTTPSNLETAPSSNSPEQRYHGRGGVQNRIRKDLKGGKLKDEEIQGGAGAKKEKKTTGLKAFVRGKTE